MFSLSLSQAELNAKMQNIRTWMRKLILGYFDWLRTLGFNKFAVLITVPQSMHIIDNQEFKFSKLILEYTV